MSLLAEDMADASAAQKLDAKAESILSEMPAFADLPPPTSTRGPRQEALRALARAENHGVAIDLHREADEHYWRMVVRHADYRALRVRYWIRRVSLREPDVAALIEDAWFAAARRFDPDREEPLAKLAYWHERSVFQVEYDKRPLVHGRVRVGHRVPVRIVYLDSEERSAEDDRRINEVTATDDERIDPRQLKLLNAALADLSSRERKVLLARVDDQTLAEVGAEVSLSRERVRQIELNAYRRVVAHIRASGADIEWSSTWRR